MEDFKEGLGGGNIITLDFLGSYIKNELESKSPVRRQETVVVLMVALVTEAGRKDRR